MDFDIFGSHEQPDEALGPALSDTEWVFCPHCGESCELLVDLLGGSIQEYVQDCEVCCSPWLVRVRLDGEGYASVAVTTLDNE
jgi:hypothetical protein